MLQTKNAHKCKVFVKNKKGRVKKFGKVRNVVFYPDKPRAVGVIVKRPDLLWMIKRKDRFAAIDKVSLLEDGNIIVDLMDSDAWDNRACKRLGVDFDECIIWDNMAVRNMQGQELGLISNIEIDDDCKIACVDISSGGAERALLGAANIDASKLKGYDANAQAIIADIQPEEVEVSGGVAGKAGEAWAKGTHRVSESQADISDKAAKNIEDTAVAAGEAIGSIRDKVKEKVGTDKTENLSAKAGEAVNDGAYKLGQQLRKSKGMFHAFKEEFDKASK